MGLHVSLLMTQYRMMNTCISADDVEYMDVVDAVNIDDCVLDHVCGSSKFKLVSADQLTSATIHESMRRY